MGQYLGPAPGLSMKHWWQEEDSTKRAVAAWRSYEAIKTQQTYRADDHLKYYCMYGSRDMAGLLSANYGRPIQELRYALPYNIIKKCSDTRQSRICVNRPSPAFVTSGGTWRQQQKAKLLNKFRQALFYEAKIYELAPVLFRDSEITGDGVVQVYEEDGRVCVDRVLSSELQVDELDGKHGKPRQMSRVRQVAREVIKAQFADKPDCMKAIEDAPASEKDSGEDYQGDMIDVLESWHIPSGKDSGDGWHIGSLRGQGENGGFELWKEEIDSFPFVFLRGEPPSMGFWSQPPIASIVGNQVAINRIYHRILEALKYVVPQLLSPRSARVNKNQFTNRTMDIIEFDGITPPSVMQASFVPKDLYEELKNLEQQALDKMGVSEMDVSSIKPAGLNSGQAIREWSSKTTTRLAVRAQQYEQFFVDLSRAMVKCAQRIAEREYEVDGKDEKGRPTKLKERQGYRAKAPSTRGVEFIDWLQIDLKEDEYVIQSWPVSMLPQTPEGRIDKLVEWMQLGLIDGVEFRRLSEMPDLESSNDIATSALEDAQWTVEQILEKGKRLMPEPYQDLGLLLRFALASIGIGKRQKYPKSRIDALRVFADNCVQLMQPPAPEEAPALPPDPSGGMPAPGMEPVPQLPGPMNAPPMAA